MELIGKQIAIETILGQPPELHYPSWYAAQIEKLPPAPPEYLAEQAGILVTDADTISRQAAIDALKSCYCGGEDSCGEPWIYESSAIDAIKKLPPAQPKRGKWIDKGITGDWQYQTDGRGRSWHEWQCDQCKDMVKKRSFYCPNCGADMREVTE